MTVKALDRCFSSEVGFLCPKNVLKNSNKLAMVGFCWNPDLKLSFPRNHVASPNCEHIQPLIPWKGFPINDVWYLNCELSVSPLAIYSFPCNVSFIGMETSLATCPESLTVSLPLFSTDKISYVLWDPSSDDISSLELHHASLPIPRANVINRTVINDLDEMFQYYDSQLSSVLEKADSMIDQIEVTTESTITEYIAFVAFGLSILNLFVFCVTCQCIKRLVGRQVQLRARPSLPPKPVAVPTHCHHVCTLCARPVKPVTSVRQRIQMQEPKEHLNA